MAGSYTGYIENAIVGSQIRLRFDADFDLTNPDRSEFFYAKCGCYGFLFAPGTPNYDPKAAGPGKVVAKSANLQELQLNLEFAPSRRFSMFADVPERSIQFTGIGGSIPSATGLGDFRAGFKFGLLASETRYLTFQARAYFPTGHSSAGLGTNHYSFEPALVYNQRLAERWTISSQFGDWHPIGGSTGVPTATTASFAGDILKYGLGASYDLTPRSTYAVTPVFEMVGWSVLSGFVTNSPPLLTTSGVNIVNAKIGARLSFASHNSIYVGFGHAITRSQWYADIFRLEYRYVL